MEEKQKNQNVKKVTELKLVATMQSMEEKDKNDNATGRTIEFIKYSLVIDGVQIGIGVNDKFKELLKYLVGATNLQVGESVVVEVK